MKSTCSASFSLTLTRLTLTRSKTTASPTSVQANASQPPSPCGSSGQSRRTEAEIPASCVHSGHQPDRRASSHPSQSQIHHRKPHQFRSKRPDLRLTLQKQPQAPSRPPCSNPPPSPDPEFEPPPLHSPVFNPPNPDLTQKKHENFPDPKPSHPYVYNIMLLETLSKKDSKTIQLK